MKTNRLQLWSCMLQHLIRSSYSCFGTFSFSPFLIDLNRCAQQSTTFLRLNARFPQAKEIPSDNALVLNAIHMNGIAHLRKLHYLSRSVGTLWSTNSVVMQTFKHFKNHFKREICNSRLKYLDCKTEREEKRSEKFSEPTAEMFNWRRFGNSFNAAQKAIMPSNFSYVWYFT